MIRHMPRHRHDWSTVQDRIRERMKVLRIDQAGLARAAGISDATVRGFMNGQPRGIPREPTRWAVCDALGWTQDSIDKILTGGEPELAEVATPRAVTPLALADRGTTELVRQAELVDQLVVRVAQLEARMTRLEQPRRGREES